MRRDNVVERLIERNATVVHGQLIAHMSTPQVKEANANLELPLDA